MASIADAAARLRKTMSPAPDESDDDMKFGDVAGDIKIDYTRQAQQNGLIRRVLPLILAAVLGGGVVALWQPIVTLLSGDGAGDDNIGVITIDRDATDDR